MSTMDDMNRDFAATVGQALGPDGKPRPAKYKDYMEVERASEGMKSGGKVTASSRADGCCIKGKTKGTIV